MYRIGLIFRLIRLSKRGRRIHHREIRSSLQVSMRIEGDGCSKYFQAHDT
jgi:hypothetical protein